MAESSQLAFLFFFTSVARAKCSDVVVCLRALCFPGSQEVATYQLHHDVFAQRLCNLCDDNDNSVYVSLCVCVYVC